MMAGSCSSGSKFNLTESRTGDASLQGSELHSSVSVCEWRAATAESTRRWGEGKAGFVNWHNNLFNGWIHYEFWELVLLYLGYKSALLEAKQPQAQTWEPKLHGNTRLPLGWVTKWLSYFKILIQKIVLNTTAKYAQGELTCLSQNIFILIWQEQLKIKFTDN